MNQSTIHDYVESLNVADSFVEKLLAFDQFGRKTVELLERDEFWLNPGIPAGNDF